MSSQPKALYILFFAELWERFSYYGLRVLLILYLTLELKLSDTASYGIYGIFFTLVNASTVLGSYVADRYLGNRRAIHLGSFIIIIGHVILFLPCQNCLTIGLSFIIAGTGFFKANITSLLGQCYHLNDSRRDSGFTIFYMGVNLGAFLSPFICGYIGRKYGWNYGFGISGLGMVCGLGTLLWNDASLKNMGQSPHELKLFQPYFLKLSRYHLILLSTLLTIPLFSLCIQYHDQMANFLYIFGLLVLLILVKVTLKCHGETRKSMIALIIMIPFFMAFWVSFEQAGASINLFIHRHVDRQWMNFTIETTWFQSLSPFLVIMLSPFFSGLWLLLKRYRIELLTPAKFALALIQVSLSFWFLKKGVEQGLSQGMTSMLWIFLAYLFRTSAELCIVPISLSMITKLAPPHLTSFMMSVLFLSIAFSQFIAQRIASHFSTAQEINKVANVHDKIISLNIFGQIFEFLIYFPFIVGIIMFMVSPFLKEVFRKHP